MLSAISSRGWASSIMASCSVETTSAETGPGTILQISSMRVWKSAPSLAMRLGQVVMWRHKLTEQLRQMRLGESNREQPLIKFDDLTRFSCPRGINDADWLPSGSMDGGEGDDAWSDGGLFT